MSTQIINLSPLRRLTFASLSALFLLAPARNAVAQSTAPIDAPPALRGMEYDTEHRVVGVSFFVPNSTKNSEHPDYKMHAAMQLTTAGGGDQNLVIDQIEANSGLPEGIKSARFDLSSVLARIQQTGILKAKITAVPNDCSVPVSAAQFDQIQDRMAYLGDVVIGARKGLGMQPFPYQVKDADISFETACPTPVEPASKTSAPVASAPTEVTTAPTQMTTTPVATPDAATAILVDTKAVQTSAPVATSPAQATAPIPIPALTSERVVHNQGLRITATRDGGRRINNTNINKNEPDLKTATLDSQGNVTSITISNPTASIVAATYTIDNNVRHFIATQKKDGNLSSADWQNILSVIGSVAGITQRDLGNQYNSFVLPNLSVDGAIFGSTIAQSGDLTAQQGRTTSAVRKLKTFQAAPTRSPQPPAGVSGPQNGHPLQRAGRIDLDQTPPIEPSAEDLRMQRQAASNALAITRANEADALARQDYIDTKALTGGKVDGTLLRDAAALVEAAAQKAQALIVKTAKDAALTVSQAAQNLSAFAQASQEATDQAQQAREKEKLSVTTEKSNTASSNNTDPGKAGLLAAVLSIITAFGAGIAATLGLQKLLRRSPSPSQPIPPSGSRSFFEFHHVDPNNATTSKTSLVIPGRAVSLSNNAKAAAPALTVLALPRRPALLAIGYESKTLALPYNPAATENRPAVPTAGTPIVPGEQPVQKPVADILTLYAAAKQEIAKHNKAARTDKTLKLDANAQTALRNLVVALQDKAATAVAFDTDAATAFASARYAYNMVFKHYEKERSLGILQTVTDNLDAIGAKDAKLGQLAASFAQRKATGKTKEATDIRKTAKAYKAPERNDAAVIELANYKCDKQLAA